MPDPRIYRRAFDLLGVEPACVLLVDDRPGNVVAAAHLGMRTLLADRFDAIAGDVRDHIEAWVGGAQA